jgi:hypothetical protein
MIHLDDLHDIINGKIQEYVLENPKPTTSLL